MSFLQRIWVKEADEKEREMRREYDREGDGDDTGRETESHEARGDTHRKLFGQSSTMLSFVTLGQNL